MKGYNDKLALMLLTLICILHRLAHALRKRDGVNRLRTRNVESKERKRSSQFEVVNDTYQGVKVGAGNITSSPHEAYYKNALSFGFIFAVNAIKTIELTEIITYVGGLQEPKELEFAVCKVYGGFSEDNIDGNEPCTLITSGKQTTNDTLNINLHDCMIPEDNIMGIYIMLKTQNLLYSATESNLLKKLGQPYGEQNSHIALLTGAAVSVYPLKNQNDLIQPRYWWGSIKYNIYDSYASIPPGIHKSITPSLHPSHPSSKFPSVSPSWEPTRITEAPSIQPFSSWKQSSSPSAIPSTHESTRPSLHPSSKSSLFIQYLYSDQTFTLLGNDLEFMDTTNDIDFRIQVNKTLNDFFRNDTNITITSVKTQDETLYSSNHNEITATITAKYSSTRPIDFSSEVQYAITESRQIILDNLSNHSAYFKSVDRIGSITTPTKFQYYKSSLVKTSITFFGPGLSEMNNEQLIEFENIVTKYLNQSLASANATAIIVLSKVYEQMFSNQNYLSLSTNLFIQGKYLPTAKFDLASTLLLSAKEGEETLMTLLKKSNLPNFQNFTFIHVGTEVIGGEVLSDNDNHNATNNSASLFVVDNAAISIGVCAVIALTLCFIFRKLRHRGAQNVSKEVSDQLNNNFSSRTLIMLSNRHSSQSLSRHDMDESCRHTTSSVVGRRKGSENSMMLSRDVLGSLSRRSMHDPSRHSRSIQDGWINASETSNESWNVSNNGSTWNARNRQVSRRPTGGNIRRNRSETNMKKKIGNSRRVSFGALDKQISETDIIDALRASESKFAYEIGRSTHCKPIPHDLGKLSERKSSFNSRTKGFESTPERSFNVLDKHVRKPDVFAATRTSESNRACEAGGSTYCKSMLHDAGKFTGRKSSFTSEIGGFESTGRRKFSALDKQISPTDISDAMRAFDSNIAHSMVSGTHHELILHNQSSFSGRCHNALDKQTRQTDIADMPRASDSNVACKTGNSSFCKPMLHDLEKFSERMSSDSSKTKIGGHWSNPRRTDKQMSPTDASDETRASSETAPASNTSGSRHGSRRRVPNTENEGTRDAGIERKVMSCENTRSMDGEESANNSGIGKRVPSCGKFP